LHGEVRGQAQKKSKNDEIAYETPYVVMFQQVNLLSGDASDTNGRCGGRVQECWGFEHPRRDMVLDSRGERLMASL
jgi:protein arginine N-methyltransferase 5